MSLSGVLSGESRERTFSKISEEKVEVTSVRKGKQKGVVQVCAQDKKPDFSEKYERDISLSRKQPSPQAPKLKDKLRKGKESCEGREPGVEKRENTGADHALC